MLSHCSQNGDLRTFNLSNGFYAAQLGPEVFKAEADRVAKSHDLGMLWLGANRKSELTAAEPGVAVVLKNGPSE